MVGTSKILTVSYGTFSCTLEGFDDPFSTMRSIAEYFRDLAADDRYFGAEPPTPDAEMLHRIAEREVQRKVIARVDGNAVTLRQMDPDDAPDDGPGKSADDSGPSRKKKKKDKSRAKALAMGTTGQTRSSDAPAQSRRDPVASPKAPEDFAAKMLRIRAAVARSAPVAGFVEDQHSDAPFGFPPISSAFVDVEAEDAEVLADADAPDDNTVSEDDLSDLAALDGETPESHDDAESSDQAPDGTLGASTDEEEDEGEDESETGFDREANVSDTESSPPDDDQYDESAADAGEAAQASVASVAETDDIDKGQATSPGDESPASEVTIVESEIWTARIRTETTTTAAAPRLVRARVIKMRRPDIEDDGEAADNAFAGLPDMPVLATDSKTDAEEDAADSHDWTTLLSNAVETSDADEADDDDISDESLIDTDAEIDTGKESEPADTVLDRPMDLSSLFADDMADEEPEAGAETDDNLFANLDDDMDAEDVEDDTAVQSVGDEDEATDAQHPRSTLTDDDEADLMAELAAVEADGSGAADENDAIDAPAEAAATDEHAELRATLASLRAGAVGPTAAAATAAPEEQNTDRGSDAEEHSELIAGSVDAEMAPEAQSDEDSADDDVSQKTPRGARIGKPLKESSGAGDDASVTRILAETNSQLDDSDASRRRSTIAHLKAAVAATRADRDLSEPQDDHDEDLDQYRHDLERVVRPRRPGERTTGTTRRLAPLMLVSEQRVDVPSPETNADHGSVLPRRITSGNLALLEDDNDDEDDDPTPASLEDVNNFDMFARDLGATELPELLEAAAAYSAYVEGRPHFSRPQLMKRALAAAGTDVTREEGLRAFGTLLRTGKIQKLKRGQFVIAKGSRFRPEGNSV